MKNVSRTYTDFNEFVKNEPELVQSLIQMMKDYNDRDEQEVDSLVSWNYFEQKYEPMKEIGDIIGLIQDWGDYDESIDSLYVERTYSMDTDDGKFTIEAYGSSYRKDQSICDEEMSDEITVIDNEILKIEAEREKAAKKEKTKIDNAKKWQDFITESQKVYVDADEILNELMNNYSFPTKLK